MRELTPLGWNMKIAMLHKRMTNSELAEKVAEDTGMFCDDSYICKIKTGERNPDKIISSIKKILEIE